MIPPEKRSKSIEPVKAVDLRIEDWWPERFDTRSGEMRSRPGDETDSRIAVMLGLIIGRAPRAVLGEDLRQAWDLAIRANAQLQAQQAESMAAGLNLKAARLDRLPSVRSFTFNAFLTATPSANTSSFFGSSAGGSRSGTGGSGLLSGLPSTIQFLGTGQRDLPVSLTFANLPLYTGGRLLRNIDYAGAQLGARAERGVPHGPGFEAHRR